MYPTLLKIGPVPINSYGLMIAIGFIVATYFMRRDAAARDIDPDLIYDMGFWALIIGIVSTRLLHIIMYPENYAWSDPIGWIAIWRGGLVFQGAVPAVVFYCWWRLRRAKVPFWRTADAVMPYVPLGHAFGRMGCLFKGCCYGQRTEVPWGIRFPRVPWDLSQGAMDSPAYLDHCKRFSEMSSHSDHWSYPIHPTQLYAAAGLVSICLIMLAMRKKWHPFEGFTLPAYFTLYGILRFIVEYFRGDHNPTHILSLSDQQVFSLLFSLTGILLFVAAWRWDQKRKPDKDEPAG